MALRPLTVSRFCSERPHLRPLLTRGVRPSEVLDPWILYSLYDTVAFL